MDSLSKKPKSLLKSWRIGTRKHGVNSAPASPGTTSSTEREIVRATQIIAAPVTTVVIERNGKDIAGDDLTIRQNNIPVPVTPTPKDQYMLYPLHKLSSTNFLPSEGQFPIDIVAVHGLDGGAHKTWTHPNNHYWLQDSLPNDFPGSRVYSFGYPAEVLFSREKSGIPEFATALLEAVKAERKSQEQQRRPLIFICHSMGGIVVKKAFNIAVFEKRYQAICAAVPAIVFFATPHRGSEHADFFKKLARVVNVSLTGTSRYTGKTRVDLIESLSKQSSALSEISKQFRLKTKDLKIFSLLESTFTPPLKEKVVDDMSARLDVETEHAITMLGCDHRSICRFEGKEDPNYKTVFNILQELAVEATTKFQATITAEDEPCLHSLSYQSMTSRAQETTLTNPHPKSCTWILTHPSYLTWSSTLLPPQNHTQTHNQLLWIKGHPGTGKSTLLSFLYHRLAQQPTNKAETPIILSFFFHGTGTSLQKSHLGMFRSLLHQVYTQSFSARKIILSFYQQKVKENGICGRDWEWNLGDLRSLFRDVVTAFKKGEGSSREGGREIVMFVDALDEARLRGGEKAVGELVGYFRALGEDIVEKGGGRVRICVSSRHYPVISKMEGLEIHVEEENTPDIAAFISHQLISGVVNWELEKLEERREFERAFVQKANGVFLWARIRIEKIVKGLNDGVYSLKDVREMIELESNELSDLYKGVLLNDVEVGLRNRSFVMLRWVCLAERPLTLGELKYAMACDMLHDENSEDIEYEEVKPFVDEDARMEKLVKSLSGGLAEVRYCAKEGTIQLFHQSVNDFLRDDGLAILHSSTGIGKIERAEDLIGFCEDTIAKSCLRYLRCGVISERAAVWMIGIEETYTFIHYATVYWAVHAENAERHGIGQEYLVQYFASSLKFFETWRSIYRAVAYRDPRCPGPLASVVHIASIFNLQTTAVCSLQTDATLNDEDDINGSTPLALAAKYGHDTLVQRYMDMGARVTGDGPPPVELAAAYSQVSTVELLIQNETVLGEDTGIDSALVDAAEKGNMKMLQVLIETGADVNQVRGHHGTALAGAAYGGKENVVKLLVSNGADVNMKGGSHGCGLQAATCGPKDCRESIVGYLLSQGADVNLQGGVYGNPLQAAASMGEIEIVKLLLSKGADVNAHGGEYGTALQAAVVRHQRMEVIQLLLAHGADVNAQTGEYGTALQGAAAKGEEEVAELLINRGADVNAKGGRYGNALQAAVTYPEGGGIVSLLLKYGAKIEGQCGYYGNVLQAAISTGNETLAKEFLSLGLDINETGGHHGDNLQAAFPSCKDSFIKYLLDQGAKVNPEVGGEEGSPLRAAIFWNRPSMVKLFLKYGADPNERIEGCSGTPLHRAARRGYSLSETGKKANLEIVRILLDNGADMEARTPWEETPIHYAIVSCHKAVVQLLLARGARLDVSQEKKKALEKILELE